MKVSPLGIVVLLALAGALVFVDSLDDVYSSRNPDVSVVFPGELAAGRQGSVSVLAVDLSGAPMDGEDVMVEIFSDAGVDRFHGRTGSDGLATVDLDIPPDVGNVTIVVSVDGQEFIQSARVSEERLANIVIQTDKPIYQPGQEVHMRFIALDAATGTPLAEPLTVEIMTPEGDKVLEETLPASEWGISAADLALSDLLPLGDYTVIATVAGSSEERTFLVDRYVLPRFIISADGLEPWYTAGDAVEFDVVADYSFGQPVVGSIDIDVIGFSSGIGNATWVQIDHISGDIDGTFAVAPDLSGAPGGFDTLLFNVTVTDGAAHSESKTLAAGYYTSPLTLSVIGDWNVAGLESTYWFIVTYPDGAPAHADLDVTLYAYMMEGWEDDVELWLMDIDDGTRPQGASKIALDGETIYLDDAYFGYGYVELDTIAVETDERGVAALSFDFATPAMFMRVDVTDGVTVSEHAFDLWGIEDGIKVVPDSPAYSVGETATFAVYSSGGLSTAGYYDVYASGVRVRSGTFDLGGGAGTIAFTVDPDMAPGIEVRATRITDLVHPVTSSALVAIVDPGSVGVSLVPSQDVYRPGDGVAVDASVTLRGTPVKAALGVRIVDSSVFELAERLTADERYDAAEVYRALLYVDGEADSPGAAAVLQPSGESRVSVGAFVHDDLVAEEFMAAGGAWLAVAIALAFVPLLLFLARRSRTGAACALLAAALVVLPSMVVLGPAADTEGPGDDGRYITGSSPDYQDAAEKGVEPPFDWILDGEGADFGGPDRNGEPVIGMTGGDDGAGGAAPRLRSYFPETWYWNPLVLTGDDGSARFELTAPDTITTWSMEVVASTLGGDMGGGEADIVVFQDFFVEPDIPVKAVLEDEFEMRAAVYNYLDEPSTVHVSIEAAGLDLVSPDNASVVLGPNSVSSVSFRLRAAEVGEATVRLDATNGRVADAVERTVRVVPNGVVEETAENGILEDDALVSISVNLSADRVPGSEVVFLKLQGSMNAVALDGAEEYIHYVSGCGEQSMSTLSMDVLAYRLLDPALGNDLKRGYEQIVVQGLLHELTFLMDDPEGEGRGIVWFPSDPAPHPWLTSWGLITFQDALDAGFDLDAAVIGDMQDFIVSQQHPDGSFTFPEWGLYEYTPDVLRSKTVATTAYVARSLTYSGYDGNAVAKAVAYIEAHLSEVWDDPYSLAIALIVLDEEGSPDAARVADRLAEMAVWAGDEAHWETESTMIDSGGSELMLDWWGYGSSPAAVETTGYAVMALDEPKPGLAVAGTRYLLNHRTQSGWFSTRDTVVAFQAIARQSVLEVEQMTVTVRVDGEEVSSVEIDSESADVTRYIDLRGHTSDAFTVEIESEGVGEIAYQLVSRVNVPSEPKPLPIWIAVELPDVNVSVGDVVAGTVTVSYNGTGPLQMVLVEIPVPAGFSPVTSDYDALIGDGVDNVEVEDGLVRLYITPVDPDTTLELPYSVRADLEATSTMTGAVVWDMYEPALRAVSGEIVLTST